MSVSCHRYLQTRGYRGNEELAAPPGAGAQGDPAHGSPPVGAVRSTTDRPSSLSQPFKLETSGG